MNPGPVPISHPLYMAWCNMKTRCYNENSSDYKNYGGRGVVVCDRWRYSFEEFYKDLAPTWALGLTLDRKDNESGYNKDNCRWISREGQNRNRRGVLLDLETAEEVRELYSTGDYTQGALAKMFRVSRGTVCHIVTGRKWVK